VAAASLFSVANKLLDLAPPALIGAAIDVVVRQEESFLAAWGIVDVRQQLIVLSAATVVIWVGESVTEYIHQWIWRNLAQTVQHELRLEAYEHIQGLDMAWFSDQSRGGLMAVLNDDVNQLERFLDGGANAILQVVTTTIAVGVVFFAVSWQVALFAIVPVPFVLLGSFWFQGRIGPRYAEVRNRNGLLNGLLANNLSGIGTIKSFTTEVREANRVRTASDDYRVANRRAIALSSAFSPLIRMFIVVGFTATMLVGGLLVIDGVLTAAAYSMLVFLTQRLLWPLTRLGSTFDTYQRAMASTQRVLDLLGTPVEIQDGDAPLADHALGDVVFSDVRFAYPGRDPVLEDFSLTIQAGSTVALVGPTGSGKSTLIRLLLRFFEPQSGTITLDGVPLGELALADLRGAVATVEQHVFLFPGTVADNIAYAVPGAPRDQVQSAAAMAEATDFIADLPQGLDTQIGEQGQKLSGGQRQRLSIARAVLKDAPILVLDEATSAVDNETEAAIQRSLARISVGRTTLVIAHRLSTIRHADHIVVMEQGRIEEQGTHEALLAKSGLYARLWAVQTGDVWEDT
jgi:ATP-binding cassette subfamily B protein